MKTKRKEKSVLSIDSILLTRECANRTPIMVHSSTTVSLLCPPCVPYLFLFQSLLFFGLSPLPLLKSEDKSLRVVADLDRSAEKYLSLGRLICLWLYTHTF